MPDLAVHADPAVWVHLDPPADAASDVDWAFRLADELASQAERPVDEAAVQALAVSLVATAAWARPRQGQFFAFLPDPTYPPTPVVQIDVLPVSPSEVPVLAGALSAAAEEDGVVAHVDTGLGRGVRVLRREATYDDEGEPTDMWSLSWTWAVTDDLAVRLVCSSFDRELIDYVEQDVDQLAHSIALART